MPKKHASDTRGAVVWLAGALLVAVVACGEGNGAAACLPEDVQRCTCDDGSQGFRVCDPEAGTGYSACACDGGASPYLPEAGVEAGPAEGGEGGEGGMNCTTPPFDFLCPCTTNADCADGDCGSFPAKGNHCTKACSVPTDCPAPSPGCNMMGQCKVP